ncbi:MAG: hypothetical protein WCI84_05500 [Bacteroidota bacterium]
MKTTIVIVVGAVVSALIIIQVLFLLYANKPEIFVDAGAVKTADSLQQTETHVTAAASNPEVRPDTLEAEIKPTLEKIKKAVQAQKESVEKKEQPNITAVPEAKIDTVDVKAQAQMLEAMGADGASKIMRTMNDKEVKAILPKLKKRTAAKILVSFDPDRAARLLR